MRVRWSVVGVGTAGRARARAILSDPGSELVRVWRGRYAGEIGVPIASSWEEAIAPADAVAIASPTEAHEAQVEAALLADRHVVVEYPMALSEAAFVRLFALARAKGRVLHEEHIELLTGAATALRSAIAPADVAEIDVAFSAPGDPIPGLELAWRNVARVSRLVDVAGPIAAIESLSPSPGRLEARLRTAAGAEARLHFTQGPGLRRTTELRIRADRSEWHQRDDDLTRDGVPVPTPRPTSLFAEDHRIAMARIVGGAPPPVGESRLAHVARIVQRLSEGCNGALH
jgi:hypothetical protein